MHFEADKLAEAGDYEAAEAKRAEAIEAKRVGMEAYKRRKAKKQRVALQSSLLPPMDEEAPAKPLGLIPPTYVQLYYQAEVLQREGKYAEARAKRREAAQVKRDGNTECKIMKKARSYTPRRSYLKLTRDEYESMSPY